MEVVSALIWIDILYDVTDDRVQTQNTMGKIGWLVGCWGFTSWQHPDGYRLVTVHTHGDCIAFPNWETRPPSST